MKNVKLLTLGAAMLCALSCGTSRTTVEQQQVEAAELNLQEDLKEKNRISVPLLIRIRQLPGVALREGVPVFTKTTTTVSDFVPYEPLYILDGYIVGNSFSDLDQLVRSIDVQKIEVLSDADASFYGSRAANGVIKVTTYQ